MKLYRIPAILIIMIAWATAQGQTDPLKIVDQFFPQKFVDFEIAHGLEHKRGECFAIYDHLPDGTPRTIMAGYTSGLDAAIDVIQRQPDGSYRVVDQPSGLDLVGGMDCSVELHDVDGEGNQEVWYTFGLGVRAVDGNWIFKWDGSHLINIGPVAAAPRGLGNYTELSKAFLLDVYHDGTLQIISNEWEWTENIGLTRGPFYLYRYSGGKYVLDTAALAVEDFYRSAGKPAIDTRPFRPTSKSTGPYLLRVTNGEANGSNRVSSGNIFVNGIQVVSPADFSQQI